MSDEPSKEFSDSTRKAIRRAVKQMLHEFQQVSAQVSSLPTHASALARKTAEATREHKISTRLRQTSVEELAKGQQIRSARTLSDRGVKNAEQVLQLGERGLTGNFGVQPETARKLVGRAAEYARPRLDDMGVPSAPDLWQGADATLAAALVFWHKATRLVASPAAEILRDFVAALSQIERDATWYRWPLSNEAKRRQTRLGFAVLRQQSRVLREDYLDALKAQLIELKDLDHHQGVSVDRSYWRKNSAEIQADLESLHTASADPRVRANLALSLARHGGVDGELQNRMNRLRMDLSHVKRRLRAYQDQGARFAISAERGILGDEMGLGKTTQALAAVGHSIGTERSLRHVVICPAALIDNWVEEIELVLTGVDSHRFEGKFRKAAFGSWSQRGGILLTSYEQASHLPGMMQRNDKFGFLIVDEAHNLKNPTTVRARTVSQIAPRASRVLLMTGTVLVNSPIEVPNLLDFVDDQLAAHLRYWLKNNDPLANPDAFRQLISSRYLRRKQEDVLSELPPLTIQDVPKSLGEGDVPHYRAAVATGDLAKMRISASAACGVNSAKMRALKEIIADARCDGRKALIFSQYVRVLEVAAEVVGQDCFLVHGAIASPARRSEIEAEFRNKEGFAALVYQISIGGVGKNLQDASTVVLMEPPFTSAAERQAIGRAHRMGQTEHVVCHRLIASGTTDERIAQLIGLKAELVNNLTDRSALAELLERHEAAPINQEVIVEEQRRFWIGGRPSGEAA